MPEARSRAVAPPRSDPKSPALRLPTMSETPITRVRSLSEPPIAPDTPKPTPPPAAAAAFGAPPAGPKSVEPRTCRAVRRRPAPCDRETTTMALKFAGRRISTGSWTPSPPAGEMIHAPPRFSLKRQWDDDLEAELEAAPWRASTPSAFDVEKQAAHPRGRPRTCRQGGRGQEGGQGVKKGKVIGVRGKSVFIDLGGQERGRRPGRAVRRRTAAERRRPHRGRRRPLRHRGGPAHPVAQGRGRRGRLEEPPQGPDRRGPRHQGEQGRPGGRRRRHPRLPADQPDRPQPRRGRRRLRQPEAPRDRHRGQPAREEPRRLAPRPARAGARGDAGEDLGRRSRKARSARA